MPLDTDRIKKLIALDRSTLWHPYTQMKDFESRDPLFVERGKGVFLYDVFGRTYYDTISSWWCITHGHNHPHIMDAIKGQLARLDQVHFAGATHEPAIRAGKLLVEFLPQKLSRVFFSDNGSTAVEVALKMAVQYWHLAGRKEKTKFISLERGYHGDTLGTMGLGGVPQFKGPFDALTFKSYRLPAPYCYRCPVGVTREACQAQCIEPLGAILENSAHEIAAVVLEPLLMGAGGMLVYPEKYLRRLEAMCQGHDILMIFDEVATGFGRTGSMFAFEQAEVVPDLLCLSKGLTGGTLPLGATVTTETIFNAFYADYNEGKTFFHGHTFTANPITTTCARASLELFRDRAILDDAREVADLLQREARRFLEFPFIGDVRGMGMVAAFELVKDKAQKTPYPSHARMGWKVYLQGLKNGLILRPLGDVTYLFLPLVMTKRQIGDCLDRLWTTFKQCEKTFFS